MHTTPGARVANLDLLRALAVGAVVLCNAAVEAFAPSPTVERAFLAGWMGVDLFFVLSGWLIGGLYWAERDRFGDVEVARFWARRCLRTIPPYLVALHVVFAAKWDLSGGALAYDVRYLLFAQNYQAHMPYWGVSWSLCVEEHFYLALPLVLGLADRSRRGVLPALALVAAASFAARMLTDAGPTEGISGLLYTETHLRLEALAFGVAASYVYARRPGAWINLAGACRRLVVPALGAIAVVAVLPSAEVMRVGFTLIDLSVTVLLIAAVSVGPLPGASSRAVRAVAITSYSVYMTHTAVLEAVSRAAIPLPPAARLVLAVGLVGAVGAVFYVAVERPTMRVREQWAPRREGSKLPPRPPIAAPVGLK